MTKILCFLLLYITANGIAQEDLLQKLDSISVQSAATPPAFKALQVVTAQSTKMTAKNEWYIVVAHRFGDVSTGFRTFFGLDDASTKLGVIYGVTDGLSLSLSRETLFKTFEGGVKYNILTQNDQIPVTLVGYHVLAVNTGLSSDQYPGLQFGDRLSYLSQALISHRSGEKFSAILSPTYIHKNLYEPAAEEHNQFLTGLGGRYKISPRISVNAEYFVNLSDHPVYRNPLSVGMDIETGGHVFQLLFSNSQLNSDIGYLTSATGNWGKGNIFFGFNLYRVF